MGKEEAKRKSCIDENRSKVIRKWGGQRGLLEEENKNGYQREKIGERLVNNYSIKRCQL